MFIGSGLFNAETHAERLERIRLKKQAEQYKKHKQTCAKNKSKRKNKNKKKK